MGEKTIGSGRGGHSTWLSPPLSWSITIVSLGSKESEKSHRSGWKTKLLSMFLAVMCQHASGACRSHSRPVLNLCEASRKYLELSPSTPPFLTLQFYKIDLTPTPNLLQISGRYSLCSGISFRTRLFMGFVRVQGCFGSISPKSLRVAG